MTNIILIIILLELWVSKIGLLKGRGLSLLLFFVLFFLMLFFALSGFLFVGVLWIVAMLLCNIFVVVDCFVSVVGCVRVLVLLCFCSCCCLCCFLLSLGGVLCRGVCWGGLPISNYYTSW